MKKIFIPFRILPFLLAILLLSSCQYVIISENTTEQAEESVSTQIDATENEGASQPSMNVAKSTYEFYISNDLFFAAQVDWNENGLRLCENIFGAKIYYHYDEDSRLSKVTVQERGEVFVELNCEYDNDGLPIKAVPSEESKDSYGMEWVFEHYSETQKIKSIKWCMLGSDTPELSYFYDETGVLSGIEMNETMGETVLNCKFTFEYDDDNNVTSAVMQVDSESESRWEFDYDSNGRLLQAEQQFIIEGTTTIYEKAVIEYDSDFMIVDSYDASYNLKKYKTVIFDAEREIKEEHTYDETGNVIEKKIYENKSDGSGYCIYFYEIDEETGELELSDTEEKSFT